MSTPKGKRANWRAIYRDLGEYRDLKPDEIDNLTLYRVRMYLADNKEIGRREPKEPTIPKVPNRRR